MTGERIITSLIPAAAIPDEILTDHPDRFRALIVESGNPVHSLPDSPRMREALDALDLGRRHRRGPHRDRSAAPTTCCPPPRSTRSGRRRSSPWSSRANAFHLRRPLLDPLPGTLPEPEIHARLVRASGALDDHDDALDELRTAAEAGRGRLPRGVPADRRRAPDLGALAPVVLYETLGPTLGEEKRAAAGAWGLAQMAMLAYPESVQRAGFADGDALFDAVLASPSGVVFTRRRLRGHVAPGRDRRRQGRASSSTSCWTSCAGLHDEPGPAADPDFPFVLSAGERRSSTANTIFRDPGWRKKDPIGALRLSPSDADALGLAEGDAARVTTTPGHGRRRGRGHRHPAARARLAAQRLRRRRGRATAWASPPTS